VLSAVVGAPCPGIRSPRATPRGCNPGIVSSAQNLWSEYEIETTVSLVDRALGNLKHEDTFAVLDSHGDIGAVKDTAEGLFYRDTRFLSHYELRIEGKRPLLLSSIMHEDKAAFSVDLTNPRPPDSAKWPF
jgi:glycogen debranching enzyme-like protein